MDNEETKVDTMDEAADTYVASDGARGSINDMHDDGHFPSRHPRGGAVL